MHAVCAASDCAIDKDNETTKNGFEIIITDHVKHLRQRKHVGAAVRVLAVDVQKSLLEFRLITVQEHRLIRQFDRQHYRFFLPGSFE